MVIIMLGAPGTGKGTVAGILMQKLEIPQVSTGDIFRKHIKEKTELGKIAESYISKGALVPDDITVNIIKDDVRVEKYHVELPKEIKNIIKCKNPRCITSCEQELDQIFVLADKDKKKYRCKYCEALSE